VFTLGASPARRGARWRGGRGEAPRQALRGRERERSPPEVKRRMRAGGERERERDEAIPFSCKYVVAACKDG